MDFIEKTGKTVEDALNDALAELKTTADKVNVEKKLKTVFLVYSLKKLKSELP